MANDGMEHISDVMLRMLERLKREVQELYELERRANAGDEKAVAQMRAMLKRKQAEMHERTGWE